MVVVVSESIMVTCGNDDGDNVYVIFHESQGLVNDFNILKNVLTSCGQKKLNVNMIIVPEQTDKRIVINNENGNKCNKCSVIFLEHLYVIESKCEIASKYFIPNPEWFGVRELGIALNNKDIHFLHKTKLSLRIFSELLPDHEHTFTSWSAEDCLLAEERVLYNNTSSKGILHVRGSSSQKQTEVLLDLWKDHPEYPKLVVLHYTPHRHFLNIPFPTTYNKNIEIIGQCLDRDTLKKIMNQYNIHICPSYFEGFGLYIDEARSVGACVITTDAEPMNCLVNQENGFLIETLRDKKEPINFLTNKNIISKESLHNIIKRVLKTSENSLKEKRINSRNMYLQNRDRFRDAIGSVFYKKIDIVNNYKVFESFDDFASFSLPSTTTTTDFKKYIVVKNTRFEDESTFGTIIQEALSRLENNNSSQVLVMSSYRNKNIFDLENMMFLTRGINTYILNCYGIIFNKDVLDTEKVHPDSFEELVISLAFKFWRKAPVLNFYLPNNKANGHGDGNHEYLDSGSVKNYDYIMARYYDANYCVKN